jgi:hypothetical protein
MESSGLGRRWWLNRFELAYLNNHKNHKEMKKLFPTLMLACLMALSLHAKHIDSLKIIPKTPTSVDTVKVVAFTVHGTSGCQLTTSLIEFTDDIIVAHAGHFRGPWTLLCYSVDTLILGVLEPGSYELHYHLMDTSLTITYNIDTTSFTVSEANGIRNFANKNSHILIYPIPASAYTIIKLPESVSRNGHNGFMAHTTVWHHWIKDATLHVFNIHGQQTHTQKIPDGQQELQLNVSAWPPGIYLLRVNAANGITVDGKVMVR